MQIDLLRHGECEGGRIFRGHTDVALTDTGWQQMLAGLQSLEDNWQAIVSSPLQRCRRFAQVLSENRQLPLTVMPGIKEINYGIWEGQQVADVWREQEQQVLAWSRDPEQYGPPEGEAFSQFRERVLQTVLSLAETGDNKLLLITHGGVIKLLLSIANNKPPPWMMQLNIGYGFTASLQLQAGQLSVLYPEASHYVYPS
ncbi:histidine phosphatase family protein [Gilvimarinus sp. DA14]|uniref:histidine phosphatase family protein n=1 Tax=Gilvimarinus sp. DA14 TaxID=2956798 RepID=UPI0020B73D5A|nr:histidine phosphatase family protein [Gilvimarinus sp. DA14]UTF60099.1 histidine phosphatase family protein [Gilvimarinus sp. DA14]